MQHNFTRQLWGCILTANELVWNNRRNTIQTAVIKYSKQVQFAASSMTSSSSGIVFAALGLGIAAILMAALAIYYSTLCVRPTHKRGTSDVYNHPAYSGKGILPILRS
jgi:hypothetical protein